MPDSPLLQLRNVSLTLAGDMGEVAILHEINLEITEGESVAIIGPSGSGKTSLMMLMAGLESPTGGEIWLGGQPMHRLNEDALAILRRDLVGIVFQSFHLIPTMTALENVAIPLELARNPRAQEEAKTALAAVGLSHRLTHRPSELSGGEQQRVAIARAFAARPRLLLADEPTGNLDHNNGEQITKLLFSLQRDYGAALVLITHDPLLAQQCGRTVTMLDGRVQPPGTRAA